MTKTATILRRRNSDNVRAELQIGRDVVRYWSGSSVLKLITGQTGSVRRCRCRQLFAIQTPSQLWWTGRGPRRNLKVDSTPIYADSNCRLRWHSGTERMREQARTHSTLGQRACRHETIHSPCSHPFNSDGNLLNGRLKIGQIRRNSCRAVSVTCDKR